MKKNLTTVAFRGTKAQFGHALKLAHPGNSGYHNESLLSVMNQNMTAENTYATTEPTFWDKVQFILKWGV